MGILNVTPDSFADGGCHSTPEAALAHAQRLLAEGADLIDVGGESTRPGSRSVAAAVERARVLPVIATLRAATDLPISVDTTKAEVAAAALALGADMVNDVSGFGYDPAMAALVASRGVPAVLMHLRGRFAEIHRAPAYRDVMAEVAGELQAALTRAERAGVPREHTLVDPGIGFSKDAAHSLETLRRLPELVALDRPILVGPSRKSFIGRVLDLPVEKRLMGTAAAVASCVMLGAHVVRVHDVREMVEVVRVCDAIQGIPPGRAA